MESPHAAVEGMHTKARDIHALWTGTSIEGGEDAQEFRGMPLGYLPTIGLACRAPSSRDAGMS